MSPFINTWAIAFRNPLHILQHNTELLEDLKEDEEINYLARASLSLEHYTDGLVLQDSSNLKLFQENS